MSSLFLYSIGNVFQEPVSVLNWFAFQKHTRFVHGKDSIIVNDYGDAFTTISSWEIKAAAHTGFFRYWLLTLLNNVFLRTSYRRDTQHQNSLNYLFYQILLFSMSRQHFLSWTAPIVGNVLSTSPPPPKKKKITGTNILTHTYKKISPSYEPQRILIKMVKVGKNAPHIEWKINLESYHFSE